MTNVAKTSAARKIQSVYRGKQLRKRVFKKPKSISRTYFSPQKNKNVRTIQAYMRGTLARKKAQVTPLVRSVLNNNPNIRMKILTHKMQSERQARSYYPKFYNLSRDIPNRYTNNYNNYNGGNLQNVFNDTLYDIVSTIRMKYGDVFHIGYEALDEYRLSQSVTHAIYLGHFKWFKYDNASQRDALPTNLSKNDIELLQSKNVKFRRILDDFNSNSKTISYYKKHKIY